jgi:hypothetical protein
MFRRWHAVVLTTLLLPLPALAAGAVEDDPYNLSLGAYFVTRTNGSIRLDRSVGVASIGTSIDWERDLGGETSMTVPRIDGYYRFAPKHRVDFSWYKIERGGTIVTQRGIDFGNVSFPVGTPIDSQLNTETTKISYTYSFYRTPEIETSLSAGLHVTQMEASLTPRPRNRRRPGFPLRFPDPVPRLCLTPKWWMRGKYELFFMDSVQAYTGALSDFTIAIEHRTFQHVGFGFGLNRSSLDLEVEDPDKRGAFSSVLSGLMLYVTVR